MDEINSEDILAAVASYCEDSKFSIAELRVKRFFKTRRRIKKNHYAVEVDIEDHLMNCKRTIKLFVKKPEYIAESNESLSILEKLNEEESTAFLNEVLFLQKVFPHLIAKNYAARWWISCHLAKSEIIVLEDMRDRWSYESLKADVLDEAGIKSLLNVLGAFHASTTIAEKQLGQPLNKLYPEIFREKLFKREATSSANFRALRLLAEKFVGERCRLLARIYELVCGLVETRPDRWNVVNHGSLWKNNIMGKSATRVIHNYRMVRYASPATDLSMILYVHATPEFRRESELDMVEYYSSVFRRTLRRGGISEKDIPSYESLFEDYLRHRLVGMMYAAMKWPADVLDDTLLTDPYLELMEHWNFCLENRIDVYLSRIVQDAPYQDGLKNVFVELFEEGERLLNQDEH